MADKEYIEREANCKDCICYDVCFVVRHNGDDRVLRNSPCKHFRNKADVVEVRHGEWVKVADLCGIEVLRCSVCGAEHPRVATAYCCDCGAKMDGKGDGRV